MYLWWWLVIVLVAALIAALVLRATTKLLHGNASPGIPMVRKGLPVVGPAVSFGIDPVGTLRWAQKKYGDVFEINLLLFRATFIMDPANYKHYFNARESDLNFDKGVEKFMQPIFGIGDMSLQPKDELVACHKILRQGLGKRYLQNYAENAVRVARSFFQSWCSDGDTRDLMGAMNDLVASINVLNFTGSHVQELHAQTVATEMNALEHNGTSPLALMMPWAPTPAIRRCAAARSAVSLIVEEEYARRKEIIARGGTCPDDFFQQFLETRLDDGSEVSTTLMLQTMIAVFFGAHHNTTNTTTWLLATLANKPDVHRACLEEQLDLMDGGDSDDASYREITHMNYLKQCLQEISRLYFTVMVPPRRVVTPFRLVRSSTTGDDAAEEVGRTFATTDVVIPEGSYVCISPITNHLDARYFPRPHVFDPDRFAPDAKGKSPKHHGMTYVQFGYGRHRCTGEHYALHVIRAIASVVLREFELVLHDGGGSSEPQGTTEDGRLPPPRFEKTIGTAVPSEKIYASLRKRKQTAETR